VKKQGMESRRETGKTGKVKENNEEWRVKNGNSGLLRQKNPGYWTRKTAEKEELCNGVTSTWAPNRRGDCFQPVITYGTADVVTDDFACFRPRSRNH